MLHAQEAPDIGVALSDSRAGPLELTYKPQDRISSDLGGILYLESKGSVVACGKGLDGGFLSGHGCFNVTHLDMNFVSALCYHASFLLMVIMVFIFYGYWVE